MPYAGRGEGNEQLFQLCGGSISPRGMKFSLGFLMFLYEGDTEQLSDPLSQEFLKRR